MFRMLQKTPEMHEWSRLSGQFDPCLFIIQYFTINEGVSVTASFFFFYRFSFSFPASLTLALNLFFDFQSRKE